MSVNIVACIGENGEVGRDNRRIWDLKSYMEYVLEITRGKIVVMGSNTFASLENNMNGRSKIVLSRKHDYSVFSDCICYNDPVELLLDINDDIYVLGGASLYSEFIEYADNLYLTTVFDTCALADCYFPYYKKEKWVKENSYFGTEVEFKYSRSKYVRKRVK